MKKNMLLIGILACFVMLSGCDAKNGPEETTGSGTTPPASETGSTTAAAPPAQTKPPPLGSLEDYFPMRPDTRYVYEGQGNEYASYDVRVDYTSENRVQQRVDNGGTVVSRVVEIKDGAVTVVFSREEAYYRQSFLDETETETEVLLMEPLQQGTTWTLADGRVRTLGGTAADVKTPSGDHQAVEVVTEGPYGKTTDYYAKGVGLVKSVFLSGETEVSSSLSRVQEGVSLTQSVRFFYPNIDDGKLYYRDQDVVFKTNDITRKALEKAYKTPVEAPLGRVLTANAEVNSLYLNEDGMVYVDVNRAFLTEMNAGAQYESMILQSVANTFGRYYQAERVVLTVDNALYESGHIALGQGEFLRVEYEEAVEMD